MSSHLLGSSLIESILQNAISSKSKLLAIYIALYAEY